MAPPGFSWVDRPVLAALAQPQRSEDYQWLRQNGIELLICLTEEPPPRAWVNEAGLLSIHVPIPDMTAPTREQMQQILAAIERAAEQGMAAAIHCTAGKGRTGTILAAYFVTKGMTAAQAIDHVRRLRSGSIETPEQEAAVYDFAQYWTRKT
jgi:atypical dual specificity phosphatase